MFAIIIIFLILVSTFVFIPKTNVNYDMTIYLPENAMTKKGLTIHEDEFGKSSMIQIMISDIDVSDLLHLKNQIYLIAHVIQVIWLDDYIDLELVPLSMIDPMVVHQFYKDSDALLTIMFNLDAYDVNLDNTIDQIKTLFTDYDISIRGEVITNKEARDIASQEIYKILFLIVPIVILLLILSSHAWIEPLLILITLGVAILLNLFTNGLLPHVSFITQTMSLALQLALSIDYAIFMIHRYYDERESHDAHHSARLALKNSFKPIATSALTTMAGFAALMFMRFTMGRDIAIVLSKGILFSFLITITVLPILLVWFDKLLIKTKHRMFIPPFKKVIRAQLKMKYVLVGLFVICIFFGFMMQRNTSYLYGANSVGDKNSLSYQDMRKIEQTFGPNNQVILVIPNETLHQEIELASALLNLDGVLSVHALVLEVDPMIPRTFLPEQLVNQYVGANYSRMILQTIYSEENNELFMFIEHMRLTIGHHYEEFYLIGQASALYDIKDSIDDQGIWIMLLTILTVGLIVSLIFKSIKIPLLLVSVILTAIWINLSILSLNQINVLYIGYLVVMSIQLGATIDYAVLLTHRYLEQSPLIKKEKAIETAFTKSSLSILISGAILSIAGFVEGVFSNIDSVTKIGYLLGRGVLVSLVSILMFLPILLFLCVKPKGNPY